MRFLFRASFRGFPLQIAPENLDRVRHKGHSDRIAALRTTGCFFKLSGKCSGTGACLPFNGTATTRAMKPAGDLSLILSVDLQGLQFAKYHSMQ
jgi:hypothetical protein